MLIRAWAAALGEVELARMLRAAMRQPTEAEAALTASLGGEAAPPLEGLPDFAAAGSATLALLLEAGEDLVREQDAVNSLQLSTEYMKTQTGGASLLGFGAS